ncbi:MAG: putative ABC transporter permease [Acutalibacteraceae bacterium]
MQTVYLYILYFFFYSAVGWAFESIYCSIGERKLINRGFLTGPMCPIYGTGTLVMEVLLYNPFRDNPIAVFFLGMLFCDIVEYLTSFIMEKLFNARWWDYKDELLNIKGRICLKHTIIWGMGSLAFVKIVHPRIEVLFGNLSDRTIKITVIVILAVFVVDVIFAVIKALDIRKLRTKLIELKETITSNTSEIISAVDEKYTSIKLLAEGKYDKFAVAVSAKFDEISNTLDKGNDIINDKRDEIILQAVLKIQQSEEKIKWKSHSKKIRISKNYGKYLNSKSIKSSVRHLSDEIKNIIDEIKNSGNRTEE